MTAYFSQQLRIPGPTTVPARVAAAEARPMINHRGPEFAELLKSVVDGVKWALSTPNEVLLLPASGSGALESAVVNLLSPGETTLFASCGAFGSRWIEMGRRYGADVIELAMPWGQPIEAEDVAAILDEHPDINVVFATHNETSTGVMSDIGAIAKVVHERGKILAADSVSGAGCVPLPTGDHAPDVVLTASQKGWMAPPGVAMAVVNERAMDKAKVATMPRWYFDWAQMRTLQNNGQTPTTPAVSILFALAEGIAMMREEGMEGVYARHAHVAAMTQAGASALGYSLFAREGFRSHTVTALSHDGTPEQLSALLGSVRTKHGIVLAGGQAKLKGSVFRIGHLGAVTPADIVVCLSALEAELIAQGKSITRGTAAAAALEAREQVPALASRVG